MSQTRGRLFGLLAVALSIAAGVLLASCTYIKHQEVSMTPLSIPGAEYVGSENCALCHAQEHHYFQLSEHASVTLRGGEGEAASVEGCETCHGPGSLHAATRGLEGKILVADEETCFSCHADIRGKFSLQHHHPVPEGRMSCSDCHSMHGQDLKSLARLSGINVPTSPLTAAAIAGQDQACFRCHKEQRGPFVFEHDALREGCGVCHNPHGSVHDKLLVAGDTSTCLRCHWEVTFNQASGRLGGVEHGGFFIGQGEECLDHHRAPHGSNIWRTFNR